MNKPFFFIMNQNIEASRRTVSGDCVPRVGEMLFLESDKPVWVYAVSHTLANTNELHATVHYKA